MITGDTMARVVIALLALHSSCFSPVLLVPGDRSPEPLLEARPRPEAKELLGAARVQGATGLTVGLAGIPHDLSLKANQLRDDVDRDP